MSDYLGNKKLDGLRFAFSNATKSKDCLQIVTEGLTILFFIAKIESMENKLPLLNNKELKSLLLPFVSKLRDLLGNHLNDVILYGSYARNEAEEGSDVDLMVLVDLPDDEIIKFRSKVYDFAGDIFLNENVMLSPVIQNKTLFRNSIDSLPFYQNIVNDGIYLYES